MSIVLNKPTKLCLQQFADFFGIHPLRFNNIDAAACYNDYVDVGCDEYWSQFGYEGFKSLSRDELANVIRSVEQDIENYLGTFVAPTWVCDERHEWPIYHKAEFGKTPLNKIGGKVKFQTKYKNVHHFGQQERVYAGSDNILFPDVSGDFIRDSGRVRMLLSEFETLNIKPCDMMFFQAGSPPTDDRKICPIREITYSTDGGFEWIEWWFDLWLLIRPELYIYKRFDRPRAFNICDEDIYMLRLDFYYDRANACLPQVEMVWTREKHPSLCKDNCDVLIHPACVQVIDHCKGIFTISPQGWNIEYDEDGNEISRCVRDCARCGPCVPPDFIRVYYKSGCGLGGNSRRKGLDEICSCSCNGYVCEKFIDVIAKMTMARLPKKLCCHVCYEEEFNRLQVDTAKIYRSADYYKNLNIHEETPFGTRVGEIESYRKLKLIKENLCSC